MAIVSSLYHTIFKRTSTLAFTLIVGAFFFERAVDVGTDYVYEKYNEGYFFSDCIDPRNL
ncbi:UNVERIFIED_CONTAM: Uqcr10 [Trichonephila clavipes]